MDRLKILYRFVARADRRTSNVLAIRMKGDTSRPARVAVVLLAELAMYCFRRSEGYWRRSKLANNVLAE